MLWYVAFIAAVNLGAGYYWGAYLRRCPRCVLMREAEILALSPTTGRVARATSLPMNEVSDGVRAAEESQDAASVEGRDSTGGAAERTIPLDPVTGLVTRDFAEQLLAQLTTAGVGNSPATIALIEVNRIGSEGKEPGPEVGERLFRGVSSIVRQTLERKDTAASFADRQLLLLLPEEDMHQATRQAEEFRQRVASTEFVADGQPFQTTITCALAEIAPESTGPRLFEFLEEALNEAKRYGGNRTFMHDGNSPTPVVPSELAVAPQQLAI
jgi:diguanylate cyclase (GGDEF)-like protein